MTVPTTGDTAAEAEILAFPARASDRLRRALRTLDIALAEQREAVAGLRQELGALAGATAGLGGALGSLRSALDGAAAETARAGAEARWLEATGADWLEATGDAGLPEATADRWATGAPAGPALPPLIDPGRTGCGAAG